MIEEKKSIINYFDLESIEIIHKIISERWKEEGEPIPPFSTANKDNLDALVKIPKSNYFGFEQYPTLESKAAIIFYTLNKKHLFLNGNKRISVACLAIFLFINNKILVASEDEITEKALWLAKTTHEHNFEEIKEDLNEWIRSNIKDVEISERS